MSASGGQSGTVLSVNMSTEKGTQKRPVDEITIDELGIAGDAHAGPWHRQVTLLAQERIDAFASKGGIEVSPGDFAENMTTEGMDLRQVAVLDTIEAGGAVFEVTQIGKECHGDTCAIFRQVGKCLMPTEGIFCRTVTGGRIRPGDAVIHTPRPFRALVITMSDRASRGEYEDVSGPKVEQMLAAFLEPKRWHGEVTRRLLPDDADALAAQLASARDSGVDVVVVTGGTGVGPRDVTPDVVRSLAAKEIPGIMEHIRLKYGAEKPRALLSRSVAAVMERTLLYAIPGSSRAAAEYMAEILKTLEHLVFMLHGLDVH